MFELTVMFVRSPRFLLDRYPVKEIQSRNEIRIRRMYYNWNYNRNYNRNYNLMKETKLQSELQSIYTIGTTIGTTIELTNRNYNLTTI